MIGTDEWEGRRDIPENADIFVFFVHKSIQEYLAAKYFIQQMLDGELIESLMNEKRKRENFAFMQNNLMFFAFCGYFVDNVRIQDSMANVSRIGSLPSVPIKKVKEELIDFIAECLDVKELNFEGVAIYEESSWLFLAALPKCSQIKKLVLKDMKLKVSLPTLLRGIPKSLTYLHIDSCVLDNIMEQGMGFTFPKLKTIKFSSEQGVTHFLMSLAWSKVESLDLKEHRLNGYDIKMIDNANKNGHLESVKEIHASGNTNVSGHVRKLLKHKWPLLKTLDIEQCNLTRDDISAIGIAHKKGFLPSIDVTVKPLSSQHKSEEEDKMSDWSDPSDEFLSPNHIPMVPIMCGAWGEQEVLDLMKCRFSKQDVITIAEANRHDLLPSVKKIILVSNKNASGQLGALLGSSTWHVLQVFHIRECNLTVDDIRDLSEANKAGYLPCVQQLYLSWNKALSGQLSLLLIHDWSCLEELDLAHCELTTEDAEALNQANQLQYLPCLKKLNLQGFHNISGARLASLLSHRWPVLQYLSLPWCSLTPADCDTLLDACRHGRLPQLSWLGIRNNHIPDEMRKQLEQYIKNVLWSP